MVPVPIIAAGGVGLAVGLIGKWVLEKLGTRTEPEPSTSRPAPDSPTRRSTKPQCVKIGLMVWLRLSKQEAHELICGLLGKDAGTSYRKDRSTEAQVRAIVKLVWHRASLQEARELIRALEKLPETPWRAMRRSLRDDDDPDDPLFPGRGPGAPA